MCKCSCFFVLCSIDESNWQEIVVALRWIFRLYCFLLLLAAIDILTVPYDKTEPLVFAVFQFVLYIPNTTALMYASRKPSLKNSMYSLIAVSLICNYNIVYAIYMGVKYKNPWMLIYLFPINIQLFTLYVLYKVRQKLVRLGCPLDYNKINQGDETYHSPLVSSPVHPPASNPVDRESLY